MKDSYQIYLSHSDEGTRRGPVAISPGQLTQHFFIVGKTGTGKSTFQKRMIMQQIEAGEGVTFIDPHGDSVRDILDKIPSHKVRDVIYFKPKDRARPFGLNVLENASTQENDVVIDGIVSALHDLWPDSWGDRMDYVIRNACLALIESRQGKTLLEVTRLLIDTGFREHVLKRVRDPHIRQFWKEEYPSYWKIKGQVDSPIQNRIGAIALSRTLRNIFGHAHSTFDVRAIMDKKKIFLVNLSGIGEKQANILGSLILSTFQHSALSREDYYDSEGFRDGRLAKLQNHYLYIDEAPRFSTVALPKILNQVRKYGLGLILVQQSLTQYRNREVSDEVLKACVNLAVFRVEADDAKRLQENLDSSIAPAGAIINLGRGEVFLRVDDENYVPYTARSKTTPFISHDYGRAEKIINYSRDNYGRPRAKIEARVERIYIPFKKRHRKPIKLSKRGTT